MSNPLYVRLLYWGNSFEDSEVQPRAFHICICLGRPNEGPPWLYTEMSHESLYLWNEGLTFSIVCRLNETLSSLGYPTMPQLSFTADELRVFDEYRESPEAENSIPFEPAFANDNSEPANNSESSALATSNTTSISTSDGETSQELTEGNSSTEPTTLSKAQERVLETIQAWIKENELESEEQAFVIKPATGSLSRDISTALTADEVLLNMIALYDKVRLATISQENIWGHINCTHSLVSVIISLLLIGLKLEILVLM